MNGIIGSVALTCFSLCAAAMALSQQTKESKEDNPIKLEDITSDYQIFLFPRSAKETMVYKLRNTTGAPLSCLVEFTMLDRHGNLMTSQKHEVTLAANAVTEVPCSFDTRDYHFGVYDLQVTVQYLHNGKPVTALTRETSLAVRSDTVLPKAKPGEFRYGLDLGHPPAYRNMENWAWMAAMGTDILRREGNTMPLPQMLDFLKSQNMQAMSCVDIPAGSDRAELDQIFQQLADDAEKKAAETRGVLTYWELGNEPDLVQFYPGPIEDYIRGYELVAKAIKRGNPDAIVMNGGLSYAGHDGVVRGHKFVELVDPSTIDAVAYHAHGPGDAAERSMYNSMLVTLDMFKKSGRQLIETESGMDARTKDQEEVQAATCIQKMIFAQSVQMPFFIWFRLCFEETNTYGMTRVPSNQPWWYAREPRPSIMSYRAMVETLRGYSYAYAIDLGREGLQCHVFSQNDGNGRVCVLWVNHKVSYGTYLDIAPNAEAVKDVQVLDMYGNTEKAWVLPDGRVKVTAGEFPIFVKWQTNVPDHAIAKGHSDIEAPATVRLPFGTATPVKVTVHNWSGEQLDATLSTSADSEQALHVSPASMQVALAPNAQQAITLNTELPAWSDTSDWPRRWRVFTYVDPSLDLATFDTIPAELPGTDGKRIGTTAYLINNSINLERIAGGHKENAVAMLFAEFDSDEERTITVGAASDYWMDWFVNGERVYDTLEQGNGAGYYIYSHTFQVPLRKGKNFLAVKVLSGNHGWQFVTGGPSDLRKVLANESDRIHLALHDGEKLLAEESIDVAFTRPVQALASDFWTMENRHWLEEEPTTFLSASAITNLFFKEPDAARWWGGDKDLSVTAWLRQDANHLYLVVDAEDDIYQTAPSAEELQTGDSLEVAFTTAKGGVVTAIIGEVNGELVVRSSENTPLKASVQRDGTRTLYRVAIPRTQLADQCYLNFRVNDNDDGYRKQYVQWQPNFDDPATPESWFWVILPKQSA